jgi:hypothetical protein
LAEARPLAMKADEAILSMLPKGKQKAFVDLLEALQTAAEHAALIALPDAAPAAKTKKGGKKAVKKKAKR